MSTFESRVRLEIDPAKIVGNFREIQRRVNPCRLMPVLKANAYGLGGREIARHLRDAGAAAFGAAEINEALELAGFGIPVQILGNLLPDEVAPAVEAGLWCPVGDFAAAKRISDEAVRQKRTAELQIAVDSGMGRLGFVAARAADEIRRTGTLPNVRIRGIYSHFSSAFERCNPYNQRQLAAFRSLLAELADIPFADIHMAASDALNNIPESLRAPFNLARTGINLYGFYDTCVDRSMMLSPVLSLKTRLAAVRMLDAGSSIGYGRMHTLKKPTRIGTIAAGYADGLPLALSNRGYVLLRGVLCPVLGRVSMDYTTISLENVPEAEVGDEVVCIGSQGEQTITLDEWAQLKGTHVYDLLCSFGTRVRRVYL